MGRGGSNHIQAALQQHGKRSSETEDRFAAVLGTRRGTVSAALERERAAADRDDLLQRLVKGDGNIFYYNQAKKLHREDGPAMELADGTRKWYMHGKQHRIGGPSLEFPSGTRVWYRNGERHRIGGPALEGANGRREWYQKNKLHRDDGPAIERIDGTREWWLNGVRQPDEN